MEIPEAPYGSSSATCKVYHKGHGKMNLSGYMYCSTLNCRYLERETGSCALERCIYEEEERAIDPDEDLEGEEFDG